VSLVSAGLCPCGRVSVAWDMHACNDVLFWVVCRDVGNVGFLRLIPCSHSGWCSLCWYVDQVVDAPLPSVCFGREVSVWSASGRINDSACCRAAGSAMITKLVLAALLSGGWPC
jgi:hypothetical protein